MAKTAFQMRKWQGIADYPKEGEADTSYFLQAIDYRTDPHAITLMPASLKESGNVVTDLLKWADTTPSDLSTYAYGDTGNIYKRTSAGSWSLLHTVPSSHGNGMAYFSGDDYLYYTNDSTIGRYGPLAGTPQFTENFLGAQGGTPLNTNSLSLASASSQYATAVSSASLQVTGDLTLETFFKATSLPTSGNTMTLVGKWDESGTTMSYKMDIGTISNYFGDGSDSALTISSNTTEAPIDSACTGTTGTKTLTATNGSFAANQKVLIHQTQGSGAGTAQFNTIQSYTAGTITLVNNLNFTYTTGAQVRVIKQHTNVTVNTGITYTGKAWNGTVGGLGPMFYANGTVTNSGTISAAGTGFRGGAGTNGSGTGGRAYQGEGTPGVGTLTYDANGNGGGGTGNYENAGGGGGNGSAGEKGHGDGVPGSGGAAVGTTDLTTMDLGGGGGGSCFAQASPTAASGGNGGGIIFIAGVTVTAGTITANGAAGQATANSQPSQIRVAGGGGAGGSILFKAQTITYGAATVTATGGQGGQVNAPSVNNGGNGGDGRIHLDYLTSYTGTTNPTLNATVDNTLGSSNGYQARLGISQNGTTAEYLTYPLPSSFTTGMWNRLSIAWTSSTSTALFYWNAALLGQTIGTKTAIHSNAGVLSVGANKAPTYQNFFNGLLDDMRIWAVARTASQISQTNTIQLTGTEAGIKAYYEFNNTYADVTANANDLTGVNTPTFSTDVPFPGVTTRLDIDQSYTTTGDTYALKVAISESNSDKIGFTPLLDPQTSMDVNIAAKGSGNWTLTIHDALNNVIATATTTNANLSSSGYYEFVFSTPWRIVIGKAYHAHLTSTVADGTIVSSAHNNAATADFHTYYGFLATDTAFHPVVPFLNKLIIGNERYLATWDGAFYNANYIAFPPLTHVRCFGFWRNYLAIGTWQEKSSGMANIYDWNKGKIYFWDGIALTFNLSIEVPEGQVNAMFGNNTTLHLFAGWRGDLMKYTGGSTLSGSSDTQKVKPIPKRSRTDYIEIYPGAMNMWRAMLHFGVAANSNSTTISRGVYSWGTVNALYPNSLSLDYPISTSSTGNTVSIGLVYPIGQTLLIGWKDNVSYGCDEVNFNNVPAPYGTIQSLIQDNNIIWKQKLPLKVKADHLALATGESVVTKYKIDRETNWESTGSITNANNLTTISEITNGRGREYQVAVDLYATGSTSPTLLGLSAYFDDSSEEEQF